MRGGTLGLVLTLASCGPTEEPRTPRGVEPSSVIQAAVVQVTLAEVPLRMEVTGQVTAVSQATLSSQIQGTARAVKVREGSSVTKGELLIELDSRDLEANLARAEAEYENTRAHLTRMERLYAQDSVSKQELENAKRAFKVSEAGKRAAETKLSYTVIRAPFDGIITDKLVDLGELASPGQALLKLEDPRRLRLETTVPEGDVNVISVGHRIPVVIDALGSEALEGTVAQVLPSGDPTTHTFLVKVDLPFRTGMKTGMFGRMLLDKGATRTLVVAREAVVERGQLTGVYVVGVDNIARLRWIKAGRTVAGGLEILSGLNSGERVLAEAAKGIDGASVQVTEAIAGPLKRSP